MNKAAKRIWNIFTGIIVFLMVMLAILLVGVRIFGIIPMAVLSGSMEPTYKTGSMVYVKPESASTVVSGDVITFKTSDSSTLATHRVVRVDAEKELFYTKGDANDAEDPNPVEFSSLVGMPVFTIPYLGFLGKAILGKYAPYVLAVLVGLIALLYLVPSLFRCNAS